MEQETEALEDAMFQAYWPAGVAEAVSTAAPSEASDGASRGQPTPRVGDGNKGQQRGKGPSKEDDDPWASWGKAKRGWESWGASKTSGQGRSKGELQEELMQLRDSVFQLQKLTLRHEDYLGGIRPETSFAIFMRMGIPASIVPALFMAQKAWRDQKEADPTKLDKPKRVVLLSCMFREFAARLEKFPTQTGTIDSMTKLGWIKPETKDWCYLRWDPTSGKASPGPGKGSATVCARNCDGGGDPRPCQQGGPGLTLSSEPAD